MYYPRRRHGIIIWLFATTVAKAQNFDIKGLAMDSDATGCFAGTVRSSPWHLAGRSPVSCILPTSGRVGRSCSSSASTYSRCSANRSLRPSVLGAQRRKRCNRCCRLDAYYRFSMLADVCTHHVFVQCKSFALQRMYRYATCNSPYRHDWSSREL